jgi:hypothetical protein
MQANYCPTALGYRILQCFPAKIKNKNAIEKLDPSPKSFLCPPGGFHKKIIANVYAYLKIDGLFSYSSTT